MIDPVAVHLGPVTIRWYGVCVASGFMVGYALAQSRASRFNLPQEAPGDLVFGAMVGGIVGARFFYVLHNWRNEFSDRIIDVFKIYQGGLVFYGGFLGAVCILALLARRRGWSLAAVGDLLAPCLPLGHALGRIGCLINGCCFGRPYHGHGAVSYPGHVDGIVNGPLYVQRQLGLVPPEGVTCAPVFPIQLVSFGANLALTGFLLYLDKRGRWRGKLFSVYLMGFGMLRFLVEFGRGDYLHRPGGLTPAQWICFPLVIWGIVWFYRSRKNVALPVSQAGDNGGNGAS